MRLEQAVDMMQGYRPEILLIGVTKEITDGEFLVRSVLVQDKAGYREAVKGFSFYRVFRLKEGSVAEVNKKLL